MLGFCIIFSVLPFYLIVFTLEQQQVAETFISAVNRHASDDKYIILTVVDEPVTDMALNLYRSSFKPHNIHNFLFIGFDIQSCTVLSTESLPCFHYADFNATSAASVYDSVEFLTKMTVRNRVILETLRAGFTVLLVDLDIIFLRNPVPDIKVISSHNRTLHSVCVWKFILRTVMKLHAFRRLCNVDTRRNSLRVDGRPSE
jgi:Nucleotide-diphospho-sugar transferase